MTTRISEETERRIAKLWPSIINGIAEGEAICDVLAMAGLNREKVRAYMDAHPEARAEWNQAKADSADSYFDEIRRIINSPGADTNLARVKIDGLKWLAGKRNPREYSDKTTLDVNVKTIDLTRIISEANARLENRERGRLIEHQATDLIANRVLQEGVGAREVEQIDHGG